jgi:hypothetical protein
VLNSIILYYHSFKNLPWKHYNLTVYKADRNNSKDIVVTLLNVFSDLMRQQEELKRLDEMKNEHMRRRQEMDLR